MRLAHLTIYFEKTRDESDFINYRARIEKDYYSFLNPFQTSYSPNYGLDLVQKMFSKAAEKANLKKGDKLTYKVLFNEENSCTGTLGFISGKSSKHDTLEDRPVYQITTQINLKYEFEEMDYFLKLLDRTSKSNFNFYGKA